MAAITAAGGAAGADAPLAADSSAAPTPVFTPDELAAINKLRVALAPSVADGAPNAAAARTLLDNATLWRFLVARDFDVSKAREMFDGSLAFKAARDLPARRREYAAQSHWWARLSRRVFYGGLLPGVQNARGGPVAVERLGQIDLGGLYRDERAMDACIEGYCLYLEDCWHAVRAAGGDTKSQALIVIDATGLRMGFLWYAKTFKRITDIGPANYPEVTYRVIIVNAPVAVTAIWAAVSVFLPARTKAKVQIHGTDQDALKAVVAQELKNGLKDLPTWLGGDKNYDDVLPRAGTVADAVAEIAALEREEEEVIGDGFGICFYCYIDC